MIYSLGGISFEWDEEKANQVFKKHNLRFEEACTVFFDTNEVTMNDNRFAYGEKRFVTIGMSDKARLLVVAWTERNDNIRLITAIKAEAKHEKRYQQG